MAAKGQELSGRAAISRGNLNCCSQAVFRNGLMGDCRRPGKCPSLVQEDRASFRPAWHEDLSTTLS